MSVVIYDPRREEDPDAYRVVTAQEAALEIMAGRALDASALPWPALFYVVNVWGEPVEALESVILSDPGTREIYEHFMSRMWPDWEWERAGISAHLDK